MHQEGTHGRANAIYNWADQIKYMLNELCFSYVWNNQFGVFKTFWALSRELLTYTCYYRFQILMNLANWTGNGIGLSRKNFHYKQKHILTVLTIIVNIEMPYVNLECQHRLEIEIGRYNATHLEQLICKFCTSPHVENEYHLLLVCPIYIHLRRPRFCWSFVNIHKFKYIICSNSERSFLNVNKVFLMQSNSEKNYYQICKCISHNKLYYYYLILLYLLRLYYIALSIVCR